MQAAYALQNPEEEGAKQMKKKVIYVRGLVLLLVALCITLVGCGKKEGVTKDGYADTLYLYNWTEYMSKDVLDLFEQEYGIKVVETTYESNDEMLAKLVAGKKGTFDLAVPTNYFIQVMKENDLLEPYDDGAITNIGNINPSYLNADYDPNNEYTIPYMGTVTLTVGNKKMLDELGVTVNKVGDLMNPKLENNIVVMDDNETITSLALEGLGYDPLTTDTNQIAETKDYLMQLNQYIKAFPTTVDGRTMLARGEVAIGHIYGGDAAQAMAENSDLEIVMKDEPISLSIDCFVLLKGSKHKKEAELFIDFLLRPDISAMLTEEFPYLCVNDAAKADLSEDILNNPACFLPEDLLDNIYFIAEQSPEILSQKVDIVTEVKAAR
jgi:spermidine/putrescine-binding protein